MGAIDSILGINPFNQSTQGAQKVPFRSAQQPVNAITAVRKEPMNFVEQKSQNKQETVGLGPKDVTNQYSRVHGKDSYSNPIGSGYA